MDRNAGCEKFHAMLIERRKLLSELERLSRTSRECIHESRKAIARVERITSGTTTNGNHNRPKERPFGR